MPDPIRLARRVADLMNCSRREAELYIAGGHVRVEGAVEETPNRMVDPAARIEVEPGARAEPVAEVSVLLHKPPGFDVANDGHRPAWQLVSAATRSAQDATGLRLVSRHLGGHAAVTPLEPGASGLIVYTQQWSVRRKLEEDAALVEHEFSVDVAGNVPARALQALNESPVVEGRAMRAARVSVASTREGVTTLRFALKGYLPGRIAAQCEAQGLRIQAMRRIRIGRVALAGLASGQWRFLGAFERF